MTLFCLIQNISDTANRPCNHILTFESQERIFLLVTSSGSPSIQPNPIIPSAHPIQRVTWAVLLSKKKTFSDDVFSGLDGMGVSPASLGVNTGYDTPEGIWQRAPLTFPFHLPPQPLSLWLTREGAFQVSRLIFLFDWGMSPLCPFNTYLTRPWGCRRCI